MTRPSLVILILGALATVRAADADGIHFLAPSQTEYRASYGEATALYRARQPDFVVFADMLAQGWMHPHRGAAGTLADLWEVPTANDWLGCVTYQFPKPELLERIHFRSYAEATTLTHWIDAHAKAARHIAGGDDLIMRLRALPDWATRCENLVRSDHRVFI